MDYHFSAKYKKKRERLLRLRYLRYWGKPYNLKRVKAHAVRREPSTSVLDCIIKFPNCQITRIKADASTYMFILSLLYYHKLFVFKILHF